MTDLQALWKDLHPTVAAELKTASGLRHGGETLTANAGPTELWERAVNIRARLDSLEGIMTRLARLRSRARIAEQEARDAYNDARAQAITTGTQQDYTTGEERSAQYDLAALNERISWRKARRIEADVSEAHEYVRALHMGLDGERRDINAAYVALNVETRMERS